jgi:hypothetical protein
MNEIVFKSVVWKTGDENFPKIPSGSGSTSTVCLLLYSLLGYIFRLHNFLILFVIVCWLIVLLLSILYIIGYGYCLFICYCWKITQLQENTATVEQQFCKLINQLFFDKPVRFSSQHWNILLELKWHPEVEEHLLHVLCYCLFAIFYCCCYCSFVIVHLLLFICHCYLWCLNICCTHFAIVYLLFFIFFICYCSFAIFYLFCYCLFDIVHLLLFLYTCYCCCILVIVVVYLLLLLYTCYCFCILVIVTCGIWTSGRTLLRNTPEQSDMGFRDKDRFRLERSKMISRKKCFQK